MMRIRIDSFALVCLMVLVQPVASRGQTAGEPPDFKEVYDLIREHLPGISQAQLDRTAVTALVKALSPRVNLISGEPEAASSGPLQGKPRVFDGEIAYLRVGKVEHGLAEAVRENWDMLAATNKLKGLVLDLRYAGGGDYAAAAAAADLFLSKERPLLNWGNGVVKSKEKTNALEWPVVALVNEKTSKAAEALAAVLRETGAGLVLGSRSAGMAMMAEEFPLKNGQRLRIGTAPIQVGEGTALTAEGVKPDITVAVNPEEERAYYADPFRLQSSATTLAGSEQSLADSGNGTNRARRTRLTESELVRERKEGISLDDEAPPRRERGPEKPLVRDPALARALDLLKGLAVVRPARS